MTAADFCMWINSTFLLKVREKDANAPTQSTARRRLHLLGFQLTNSKKGVYTRLEVIIVPYGVCSSSA